MVARFYAEFEAVCEERYQERYGFWLPWKHSGFSVDQSVRLEAGDQEGVQRLMQYFLRSPFSQAFQTPLEPSPSLAKAAAALGSQPTERPRRQGGVFGLNPASFPP